jgi:cysteate synthase
VLSNAAPPYAVSGGVYDALRATDGHAYAVTNDEGVRGGHLFLQETGIVPCPEAAVAVGGLLQAVKQGRIARDDCVLLHVTGGGWDRVVREYGKKPYPPAAVLKSSDGDAAARIIDRYLNRVQRRPRAERP